MKEQSVDRLTENSNENGPCLVHLSTPTLPKSALESLIEELEAGVWDTRSGQEPAAAPLREAHPALDTQRSARAPAGRSERCWHCHGEGLCDCSTCGTMKPQIVWTAGRCAACRGAGAIQRRIQ